MKTKLVLMAALLFSCGILFAKPVGDLKESFDIASINVIVPQQVIANPVPVVAAQPAANQSLWMKGWHCLGDNNLTRALNLSSIGASAAFLLLTKNEEMRIRDRVWGAFVYSMLPQTLVASAACCLAIPIFLNEMIR